MSQLAHWRVFPHFNLAIVIAIAWGSLALAAAVYDIGRWIDAW